MARPTLKLPPRPDARNDIQSLGRKPIRGGGGKATKRPFVASEPPLEQSPTEARNNEHQPRPSEPTRPERTVGNYTNGSRRIKERNEETERPVRSPSRNTPNALPSASADTTAAASKRNEPRRFGKERDSERLRGTNNGPRHATAAPPPPLERPAKETAAPFSALKIGADDLPRLSKLMSEQGLCSRREADEWIENGWVRVDGQIINTLGTRVSPRAHIEIAQAASKHQSESVTILLHKPIGYVSGQAEDGYQPASILIRPENQWEEGSMGRQLKQGHFRGLAPAGRLDIDSTGLLVLTQDGRVARRLVGDDSKVEKEYLVRVEGSTDAEGLQLLNHGLLLDGIKLKPANVSWQNEEQLRFVLREGKKRQIRRMCELVGLTVVGLKRIRIGSINLGKLPVGKWRFLRPDEKF